MGRDFMRNLGFVFYAGESGLPIEPWSFHLINILTDNPAIVFFIILGFIANTSVMVYSSAFASTRMMFAMSYDRILPEKLTHVSRRFSAPTNACITFMVIGMICTFLFNFGGFEQYAMSVVLVQIIMVIFFTG